MNIGKGYLTYTLAALAVVGAISGYFLGFIEQEIAIQILWAGLAVFGLRRAIK